jgi:TM2 domain-containing membrane protein YozV
MPQQLKEKHIFFLLIVALLSWLIPGAGYFLLNEKKRAIIIFLTISLTFCTGLYIGSIGVINPVIERLWYIAQVMTSPLVALLAHLTAGGGYPVYGRPSEIGQIYTSVAGMLNMLCVVNVVYLGHVIKTKGVTD